MNDLDTLAFTACAHLSVVGAPTSTPAAIAAANTGLDSLTQSLNSVTALQLAQHLLVPAFTPSSSNPSLNVVHYSFHILDVHLLNSEKPWTDFPDEIRDALRTLATNVISRLSEEHPPLLFQKAVSLIVALVLREWPQRWPDFLDQLLASANPPVIACRVLEELSEQVHVFSDRIQHARRQELRHALALTLPQTLEYVTKSIETAHNQRNPIALSTTLSCLQSIIPWADLRSLFEAAVPNACLALLSSPEFRDAALSALDTLVVRQFPPNGSAAGDGGTPFNTTPANQLQCPFREVIFPGVLQFTASSSAVLAFAPFSLVPPTGAFPALVAASANPIDLHSISPEDHDFAVRFMSVLGLLGSNHFLSCFVSSRNGPPIVLSDADYACAYAFIDLLACTFSSPSLQLRFAVLPFFSSAASGLPKLENFSSGSTKGIVSYLVTAMLQSTSAAALRMWNNAPGAFYGELDDGEELLSLQKEQLACRTANLFPLLTRLKPEYAAKLCMERLTRALNLAPPILEEPCTRKESSGQIEDQNLSPGPKQAGIITADGSQHGWTFGLVQHSSLSDWHACIEAACFFVDGVSIGMVSANACIALQSMTSAMRLTFQTVVAKSDAAFLPVKPFALRVHHALYLQDETCLTLCVETLLNMAVNCTNEKLKVRQKVLVALSCVLRKLSNMRVKSISKFHEPLCQYVNAAIGNQGLLTVEKISLLEAALASTMEVQDLTEQSVGMERVLGPLLDILSLEDVRNTISAPENLLTVLKQGVAQIVHRLSETVLLMETGLHQVVRPVTKSANPIHLPSPLSRTIAPRALEIGCTLIVTLHNIQANVGVIFKNRDEMESILQPTCRELAFLLNLDVAECIPNNIGDLAEYVADHGDQNPKLSVGEVRASNALQTNGVSPPDERYGWAREKLRDLRRGGYEMVRAAIFSGAAQSDQHVQAIVVACCSNANKMEPHQIISILGRVVAPLLSFKVCAAGSDFLGVVGESGIAPFLTVVRELIIKAQRETEIFSSSGVMDIAREHGRRMVARAVTELLSCMYPRVDTSDGRVKQDPYVPPAFRFRRLAEEIISLWYSVSDAGGAMLEYGAARASFQVLAHAVELSDTASFSVYGRLLPAALNTAVRCVRMNVEEPVLNVLISALISFIRRSGEMSEKILISTIAPDKRDDVAQCVSDCIQKVAGMDMATVKVKKHRASVKAMIDRLASVEGPIGQKKQTVYALPEKLSKVTTKKSKKNRRRELEDVELTDSALDSLFGEGDPL